jgi:hypothetical protein
MSQSTVPATCYDLDAPVPYTLSPLAKAALANGVSFDDVEAFVLAAGSYNRACNLEAEMTVQAELDIALFESFHAREPRKSVLFWKGAGL